jgi:hypothetical protein
VDLAKRGICISLGSGGLVRQDVRDDTFIIAAFRRIVHCGIGCSAKAFEDRARTTPAVTCFARLLASKSWFCVGRYSDFNFFSYLKTATSVFFV